MQQTIDRAARDGKDFSHEYRLLMPDGSVTYVHAVAHAVKDASGDVEFVGAVTDVTATKRAEEALRQSQAELAHVTRVTTLGELTASIAHEVNQPLAAIVTNGEVGLRWLDREVPDLAEVREALGDMISNGRRASEIIQRLRALSRKTETQKVALDINDAISEVIPLVQQEVLSHRVSLRLELAPALPAVLGDRVQLQQVIINLIVNGMEAMAPGHRPATRAGDPIATGRRRPGACGGRGRRRRHRPGEREAALRTPSSPPSRAAWAWGYRSAARSSRTTAAGCGPRAMPGPARRFSSPCSRITRLGRDSDHFGDDMFGLG